MLVLLGWLKESFVKDELFIMSLPNGKTFKVTQKNKTYEIWKEQPNKEFVQVDIVENMESVQNFLRNNGYKGRWKYICVGGTLLGCEW